jgi:hypothetical protein
MKRFQALLSISTCAATSRLDGVVSRLVGRCRLIVSKPELKVRLVSALETKMWRTAFKLCFQFQRAPLQPGDAGQDEHGRAVQVDSIKIVLKAPLVLALETKLW